MGMFLRRGPARTRIGRLDVGSIVKLNESGLPIEFYVAKHDYESGLNGPGRTLMVRKNSPKEGYYNSSGGNGFRGYTLWTWLNGPYLSTLDAKIREVIGTTAHYLRGYNNKGQLVAGTDKSAIFQLSASELGITGYGGSALPIASTLQTVTLDGSGVSRYQWTTTTQTASGRVLVVKEGGVASSARCDIESHLYRPAFTLPSDFIVTYDMLA